MSKVMGDEPLASKLVLPLLSSPNIMNNKLCPLKTLKVIFIGTKKYVPGLDKNAPLKAFVIANWTAK